MKSIVRAIYAAAVKRVGTVIVSLKGEMLSGVRLKVTAEGKSVSCEFSGCQQSLRRLLEDNQERLKGALAKRGLNLVSMRAT